MFITVYSSSTGRSLAGPFVWRSFAGALLMLLGAMVYAAEPGSSMEERLRAQLRATMAQLQQAQNELAVLKAGPAKPAPASPSELDSIKQELAKSRAAERHLREKQKEQADELVAKYRNSYDELLKLARASEAERQRLGTEAATQKAALSQCETKNAQLYAAGKEILRAYETMDSGLFATARLPFTVGSRIEHEMKAQQYGDKLYEGRFDARSVNPANPEGSAETKPASAASEKVSSK